MSVLTLIAVNVIVPVFIIIGLGVLLHRIFHFEMNTLSKITTYFLLPAVGFVNIYQSQLIGELFIQIIGFLLLQSISLITLCSIISRVTKLDKGVSITFKNSVVLNNSGNFGIPFPSSRNSALFALEYNNHPDYAAQAVLLSTLLSSVTVTIVVFLSGKLFG